MASNSTSADASTLRVHSDTADSVWEFVKALVAPIASLKLTVSLFVLSIILIFVGTLAQVNQNMWEVINNYFHAPLVWIAPEVLMPAPWFPGVDAARIVLNVLLIGTIGVEAVFFLMLSNAIKKQRDAIHISGIAAAMIALLVYMAVVLGTRSILFPGGWMIGSVMFVNLLAAHGIRFKPQAKSTRLIAGILTLAIGVVLTLAVIESGHSGNGLQGEPPVSWATMWMLVKVGAGAVAIAVVSMFVTLFPRRENRMIELVGLGIASVVAVGLTIWLVTSGVYLGDSGMRILWQLIKAGGVAVALLCGCVLVFKKRGGIVLIHGGVGLMMVGELFVGNYVTEERLIIDEGDTVNYAVDIRSTELAVTGSSDPTTDDVFAIPLWVKGRKSSFLNAGKIQSKDLPFDVEIVDYYRNSNLKDITGKVDNKATAGKGLHTVATEVKTGSGADSSGEVDMASAYVRFFEKGSSKEIGTYLLSQVVLQGRRGGTFKFDEDITAGGKPYHVELRFKRTYKPYSLRLVDVRKDDYIGTSTPRNYSSDVQLMDPSRNVDRHVKIWMNNPLRYAGETFYQSGYHKDPASGSETTTLQVVRNTGWMIPYVACMLVVTGMFAHFATVLLRFLRRFSAPGAMKVSLPVDEPVEAEVVAHDKLTHAKPAQKRRLPKRKRPVHDEPVEAAPELTTLEPPSSVVTTTIAVVIVLLFAVWIGGKARPPKVADGEMDVFAFGKLPLVYQGRVKPFDTLARNSLRVLSTKERLTVGDKKKPAITWLLDVISASDAGKKDRVFRIDNLDLLEGTLKLQRRQDKLFSHAEIEPQMEEFRKQVSLAKEADPEKMSTFQHKVLELDEKLQLYYKLREAFRVPEDNLKPDEEVTYVSGLARVGMDLSVSPVPYAIPVHGDSNRSWEPLIAAVSRLWAKQLADRYGVDTTAALAKKLSENLLTEENIQKLTDARLVEMIKSLAKPGMSDDELEEYARAAMQNMPADVRQRVTQGIRDDIEASGRRVEQSLTLTLDSALGKGGLASADNAMASSMWGMLKAYRNGDARVFHEQLKLYQQELRASSPAGLNLAKINFETFFNNLAPFFNCAVLYLVAFVLTALGWLAWPFRWNRPFNWAAFGLIAFTLVVHTLALGARIYISGRPPVTNLYSSAIFIGWAAVIFGLVLELILRLGIGNIVAAVAGFSTLVIAHQLAGDGDTFTVLQAVLDTQFWLATHVVSITLGYATTFVAGLLGIVFIVAGLTTPVLSFKVGTMTVRKLLANMIYGVVCFALFFSFFGTVLGGLWADDSWGRFWGWDPKENGALIIVLWNALVLHARWDGMVRDRGLAVLAVVGNIVTSWSWFGVNELGVGLHSYGFTQGVLFWLGMFIFVQVLFIVAGMFPKPMWWSFCEEERIKNGKLSKVPAV